MPNLEEVCRWNIKVPKREWTKFKTIISDIVKRHGKIPVSGSGRCIGNGFELYAEAKKEKDYFLMVLSINASQVPLLLIKQLRDYMTNNMQELIGYEESYRRPS